MKRIATAFILATFFISTIVFAMAKGPIKDGHKGKTGLDGAKINCVYCHKKAAIPKKKGQDKAALYKGKYCAVGECHKPK